MSETATLPMIFDDVVRSALDTERPSLNDLGVLHDGQIQTLRDSYVERTADSGRRWAAVEVKVTSGYYKGLEALLPYPLDPKSKQLRNLGYALFGQKDPIKNGITFNDFRSQLQDVKLEGTIRLQRSNIAPFAATLFVVSVRPWIAR